MTKFFLLTIALFGLISCKQKDNEIRTQNFPKTEVSVDKMPNKEKIWVFILAGQSNMAGRGLVEPQDTIPSNRIFTLNKSNDIIIAKEPLHFYEPSLTGLDCGLSFAKELIKHIPKDISIILIPTAVGGSSISQWLGDSTFRNVKLYTNFRKKIEVGIKYGQIKGILWHQGESDANGQDIPYYKKRLSNLFVKFRETVDNKNLPILIGQLGTYSKDDENWKKINRQIELYVSSDFNSALIMTFDFKDKGDKIHFNSEGQRIMGQRFAIEYLKKHQ